MWWVLTDQSQSPSISPITNTPRKLLYHNANLGKLYLLQDENILEFTVYQNQKHYPRYSSDWRLVNSVYLPLNQVDTNDNLHKIYIFSVGDGLRRIRCSSWRWGILLQVWLRINEAFSPFSSIFHTCWILWAIWSGE